MKTTFIRSKLPRLRRTPAESGRNREGVVRPNLSRIWPSSINIGPTPANFGRSWPYSAGRRTDADRMRQTMIHMRLMLAQHGPNSGRRSQNGTRVEQQQKARAGRRKRVVAPGGRRARSFRRSASQVRRRVVADRVVTDARHLSRRPRAWRTFLLLGWRRFRRGSPRKRGGLMMLRGVAEPGTSVVGVGKAGTCGGEAT